MLLSSIHSEKVLSHGTDLKGLFIKKIHSFFFFKQINDFFFFIYFNYTEPYFMYHVVDL